MRVVGKGGSIIERDQAYVEAKACQEVAVEVASQEDVVGGCCRVYVLTVYAVNICIEGCRDRAGGVRGSWGDIHAEGVKGVGGNERERHMHAVS